MRALPVVWCLTVCLGSLYVDGASLDARNDDSELLENLLRLRALLIKEGKDDAITRRTNNDDNVEEGHEDVHNLEEDLERFDDRSYDTAELHDYLEELNTLRELRAALKTNERRRLLNQEADEIDKGTRNKRGWLWYGPCPNCDQNKVIDNTFSCSCKVKQSVPTEDGPSL